MGLELLELIVDVLATTNDFLSFFDSLARFPVAVVVVVFTTAAAKLSLLVPTFANRVPLLLKRIWCTVRLSARLRGGRREICCRGFRWVAPQKTFRERRRLLLLSTPKPRPWMESPRT